MGKIPVKDLIDQVEGGLPGLRNDGGRMDRARKAMLFYNGDGKADMADLLNDAETVWDYAKRPYRESGLTRMVVEILTEHAYSPGPTRQHDDATADELLKTVYEDNHIDPFMTRADQLSTLADVACIQVDADESRFEDRPITLRLWDANEFHAWEDPDNRTQADAVVTIDRYDQTTRYRLWTEEKVYTFVTKRGEGTSGGRVATLVGTEPHRYGCLPFAFVHYDLPVQQFWTRGIGEFVVNGEMHTNNRLSRLDQSINKHLNPIPFVRNVPDGWQAIIGQPNLFVRLPKRAMVPDGDGGYTMGDQPEIGYVEVRVDIPGAWEDARSFVNQVLEACRVPASAVRMEQTGVASGISLIVEQAPLLTRARRRQAILSIYEAELARTILRCTGNHYGKPRLVQAARTGNLSISWPNPTVPIWTDDTLDLELKKISAGTKSLIMLVQEMGRMASRDQAIEYLEQVKADEDELRRIMPEAMTPGVPPLPPDPGEGQDMGGDFENPPKEQDAA